MTSDREPSAAEQVEFAMRIALGLLEARARTEHELRAALAARRVPGDVADEVVARLIELRYLDDESYARALTSSRVRNSHRGQARIRRELQQRGVDAEVAAVALGEIDVDDEWASARAFAAKKIRTMRGVEQATARRRLQGALARRGFSADIVLTVSTEALGGWEEEYRPD